MCERWKAFKNFLADMGLKPSQRHTLERKNTNGHYEPNNCVWATWKAQANNTRRNRLVTAFGKTQTVAQWATERGNNYSKILWRLNAGWSNERAVA